MGNNTAKNNFFGNASIFRSENTPNDNVVDFSQKIAGSKKQKMINDFDSFLILENIDKTVKNRAVRINLKINALERNLARVNEELDLLQLLNLEKDIKRREELSDFKSHIEEQIAELRSEKRRFGLWYFISGFFAEKVDYEAIKASFVTLKTEIKKYDKAAISFLKSKNPDLLPFKW